MDDIFRSYTEYEMMHAINCIGKSWLLGQDNLFRFMVFSSDASLMNMLCNLHFMGMSCGAVTIAHLMCQGRGGRNTGEAVETET